MEDEIKGTEENNNVEEMTSAKSNADFAEGNRKDEEKAEKAKDKHNHPSVLQEKSAIGKLKNSRLTGLIPKTLYNNKLKKALWCVVIFFLLWTNLSNRGYSSYKKDKVETKEQELTLETALDDKRKLDLSEEARTANEEAKPYDYNQPVNPQNGTQQDGVPPIQEVDPNAEQYAQAREQERMARVAEARERARQRLENERAVFLAPASTGNGNWGNIRGAEKHEEQPRPREYASLDSRYSEEMAQRQAAAKAQEDKVNKLLNRFGGGNSSEQQQAHADKMAFFNATDSGRGRLNNTRQAPISPYLIPCGTFIPCTLVSGVNSDLPGDVIASVTEDVYDWKNANVVLIPQGTRVFGSYNSNIAWAQGRIQISWKRVVFPDGSTLELNGMAGVDKRGYSGLKDKYYGHYGRLVTAAVMTAAFSSVGLLFDDKATTYVNGTTTNPRSEFAKEIGSSLGRMGERLFSKNLNVPPTVLIRPATRLNIMVNADIPFYTGFRKK